MISIALGVFILFIVYVAIWSIRNDGAHSIEDQKGIIRMRVPKKVAAKHDGRAFSATAAEPRSHRSAFAAADQPARRGQPGSLSRSQQK